MRYWAFYDQMLAQALAAHEAARQKQGATEQQAKDETQVIVAFLTSEGARDHGLINDDGRG